MLDSMSPLWQHLRVADFLDIGVTAVLIYLALSWFRRRASFAVAFGVVAIAALYLLARTLHMFLTLHAFQFGLTVSLLALVVIFQQDLRRAFQQLASWRRREWGTDSADVPAEFDVLTEAANLLAEQRIGALMVVEGREPIDGHIRGGVDLDGKVSIPLLHSIFHPKTQGHDGAVIVRNGRIEKFGVHLPLSTNLREVGPGGTRHTAALGLAEVCDALVLVVSEERGRVSVAQEGKIHPLDSAIAANKYINTFWQRNFAKTRGWHLPKLIAGEPGMKLLALSLACMLWFLLALRIETVQRTFVDVPIEFRNVPADWSVTDVRPSAANLTIAGPQREFDTFEPGALRITIDLAEPQHGYQEISITDDQLQLPSNLSLRSADVPRISLYAFPIEEVSLPVHVVVSGTPRVGGERVSTRTEPQAVRVLLRRGDRETITSIETEPVDISNVSQTKKTKARLKLPLHARLATGMPSEVEVTISVARPTGM